MRLSILALAALLAAPAYAHEDHAHEAGELHEDGDHAGEVSETGAEAADDHAHDEHDDDHGHEEHDDDHGHEEHGDDHAHDDHGDDHAHDDHGDDHAHDDHGDDHAHEENGDDHGHEAHGEDDDADHVTEAHGLRTLHAWTRATEGAEALIWVELENQGDATITLTGGGAEIAEAGALAGFQLVNGEGSHAAIAEIPLDAGGKMVFAPFGLALRLTGLTRPLARGDKFQAVLETSAGPVPLNVEVEAADASQHSHAGHQH